MALCKDKQHHDSLEGRRFILDCNPVVNCETIKGEGKVSFLPSPLSKSDAFLKCVFTVPVPVAQSSEEFAAQSPAELNRAEALPAVRPVG